MASGSKNITSNGNNIDVAGLKSVNVNVSAVKALEIYCIGPRQLNQVDTAYVYSMSSSGATSLKGSGHGRGGSYSISGSYGTYRYIYTGDANASFVVDLKVKAYVNGTLYNAGATVTCFTMNEVYSTSKTLAVIIPA